ncbi:unnamed protein product [Closterium sp. NIES-54]
MSTAYFIEWCSPTCISSTLPRIHSLPSTPTSSNLLASLLSSLPSSLLSFILSSPLLSSLLSSPFHSSLLSPIVRTDPIPFFLVPTLRRCPHPPPTLSSISRLLILPSKTALLCSFAWPKPSDWPAWPEFSA